MNTALIIAGAILVLVLAWNFIPAFREKMRGYSTIMETLAGASLYYSGILAEAANQLVADGILPADYKHWTPAIVFAYLVIKRMQTTTPVGGGKV